MAQSSNTGQGTVMAFLRYLYLVSIARLLRLLARLVAGLPKPSPDDVVIFPSRDRGRNIKAHIYKPAVTSKRPGPVLLNLHGSGFILPAHGSDDEFCRRVARETNYTVVDLQYRLAPENPFPAALHDVEDAVQWILKHGDDYDARQFAISGFSAGGNLALAASGVVFAKDTFRSVLTFYPSTNKAQDPAERKTPDTTGKVIPPAISRLFDACYLPPGTDRKQPLASPGFAPMDKFPQNVLVVTAAQDNLCFEAETLAAKVDAAGGRNVVVRRMEQCGHGWDKTAKQGTVQGQAKDNAYTLAIEILQR
ncbi:Uu.00g117290.m01.CDS01 [Anthostomella pinea]|uniref:Uu.00g117290.m01.CDS01 n=1 Tax=Anthostomella pinea TaxID=933095 RepID=A0AAI8YGU1_9PEZI|nr:Uu.00g117290.m01.CDS01 [Anthostomella pinea]